MTVRQKLDEIRISAKERRSLFWGINSISEKIDSIRDVSSKVMSGTNVQVSDISDPTGQKAALIMDDYSKKLECLLLELQRLDEKVDTLKANLVYLKQHMVLNFNEYGVLNYYYFEGMSLDEVSEAMIYSQDWVQELKSKGIRKWQKYESTHTNPYPDDVH